MTIVRVVVDAQGGAIFKNDTAGSFDLHREHITWIFDPADFELLPIEDAGLNRAAIKVRHELVFPDTTANPPPLVREYAGARFVSNCYQVAWSAVYGDVEFRTGKSGPFNNRLEICRQQSFRLA